MHAIDQAITDLSDRLNDHLTGLGLRPEDFKFRSECYKGEFHVIARVSFLDLEEAVCVVLENDPCPQFADVLINRFRAGAFGPKYFQLKPRRKRKAIGSKLF